METVVSSLIMYLCVSWRKYIIRRSSVMTKYREIIRLASLSLSQTNIALSCGVSKKTVNKVLKAAREKGISWPLGPNQTDSVIEQQLFPKKNNPESQSNRRMPDYTHIRKELLRNGVNKKLLWTEYLEECRLSGDEPLMYSQFCYYIANFACELH